MVNFLEEKCNEATIHAAQRLRCLEENHECRVQRRFSCDRRLRSIFLSRECFSSRGEVPFLLWLSALKITQLEQRAGMFSHDDVSVFLLIVTKISLSNTERERERKREKKREKERHVDMNSVGVTSRFSDLPVGGEEEGNLRLCHWLSPVE